MKTTMRDVLAIHDKIVNMDFEEACENVEFITEGNDRIGDYMNEVSKKSKEIVLEKIKEEDFVHLVNAMSASLAYYMLQRGKVGPVKLINSGDMKPFLHTIILSVIGSLMEEKVL